MRVRTEILKEFRKLFKRNPFDAKWLNANLNADNLGNQINEENPKNFVRISKSKNKYQVIEKKINKYITLKLLGNRTYIYVNGRQFIQCIRLILNIPKEDVHIYDEVDSIDEAAKLYSKHVFQNRIVRGPLAWPDENQNHTITPEQEFWGHCSNIQAWVEHDYDTRILMSNISFPLLRELSKAGDPLAKKVYKEEIALRLESGYPSVVQYLLSQGYIQVFSSEEFQSILESTEIIKNLAKEPKILSQFLRACYLKFPDLIEVILYQILKLFNGKDIISSLFKDLKLFKFGPPFRFDLPSFFFVVKSGLENLFGRVDEKIGEDILDCLQIIEDLLRLQDLYSPEKLTNIRDEFIKKLILDEQFLDNLEDLTIADKILEEIRKKKNRCSYCGKEIPKGQDICKWCGHEKDDDEGGFFPYPYIYKPPGGAGGSRKGTIAVSVAIRT